MKIRKRNVVLSVLLVAFSICLVYYFLFIRLVIVPTGAMKNTILPGDRIAANLLLGDIHRGDIVIFQYPKQPGVRFVMRVIGLPGETIQLRKGQIFINGSELPEKRQFVKSQVPDDPAPLQAGSSQGDGAYTASYDEDEVKADYVYEAGEFGVSEPFQIPDDSYYVMGDNRDNALDSRFWGPVQRNLMVGKPLFVYWSSEQSGGIRWRRIFSKIK